MNNFKFKALFKAISKKIDLPDNAVIADLGCKDATFLSEMSLPAISNADYSAETDKALESTKNIIVIATSKENILSGWVQYEWSAFANEKRSGRKSGNIITLIDENMPITELPILLRQFEVIPMNNLESITKFLK